MLLHDRGETFLRIITGVLTGLVMVILASTASGSSYAPTPTDTTGRVCCPYFAGQLENFGGYTFRGTTTPSRRGQYVEFSYKRPWASRWRSFKVGLSGSDGEGFYILNKNAPRDRISRRDRWSVLFSPAVKQGRWKIRAVFPRQGKFARSQVVRKFWVWQSD